MATATVAALFLLWWKARIPLKGNHSNLSQIRLYFGKIARQYWVRVYRPLTSYSIIADRPLRPHAMESSSGSDTYDRARRSRPRGRDVLRRPQQDLRGASGSGSAAENSGITEKISTLASTLQVFTLFTLTNFDVCELCYSWAGQCSVVVRFRIPRQRGTEFDP